MKKEIGSHFWYGDYAEKPFAAFGVHETACFLSGRSALDYILKNIQVKRRVRRAYLPSYCCDTMIAPFLSNGIEVFFYDIVFENGRLQADLTDLAAGDIGLVIGYFGFQDESAATAAKAFKDRGMTVVEDCSHSLFSALAYGCHADYVYAALTKWTGIECGALAAGVKSGFSLPASAGTNRAYLDLRKKAMESKSDYMRGVSDSKAYLDTFFKAEEYLCGNYAGFGAGAEITAKIQRLDMQRIRARRRENARALIAGLKEEDGLALIFKEVGENDCPLFVPVYMQHDGRDRLRRYLIDQGLYMPVHWPVTALNQISDRARVLYDRELSLVCDQRYDAPDMAFLAEHIHRFLINRHEGML